MKLIPKGMNLANFSIGPGISVDFLDLGSYGPPRPAPSSRTSTRYLIDYGDGSLEEYTGVGFTYGSNGYPTGGTITSMKAMDGGSVVITITDVSLSASTLMSYFQTGNDLAAQSYIFAGSDHLIGEADIDSIRGFTGDDYIEGKGGNDLLYGDEGNDIIDGGAGKDTAGYDAAVANFSLSGKAGTWTVVDKRANGLGTDVLKNVELIKFSDKTVDLSLEDFTTVTAVYRILQFSNASGVAVLVSNGLMTKAQALSEIYKLADATTTVANLAYQFFTGKTPSSAGLDYLVAPDGSNPNNLNSAYYQSFNIENRYINFSVNLGKLGEGKATFAAKYGNLNLFDATREAYKTIFGGTPTDAKIHTLIDSRVDYFASYGGDGASGIGTKAAMVGWLLAEAAKADVGMYALSSNAYLERLGSGVASSFDLVGVYGKPEYNFFG